MTVGEIEEKLGRLARLRAKVAARAAERDKARAKLLKPVQPKLDAVEREYEESVATTTASIEAAEAAIKECVAALGVSVKGESLHAVYVKPRVAWNNDKLAALEAVYPAISTAKTVAEKGAVQIREVKGGSS